DNLGSPNFFHLNSWPPWLTNPYLLSNFTPAFFSPALNQPSSHDRNLGTASVCSRDWQLGLDGVKLSAFVTVGCKNESHYIDVEDAANEKEVVEGNQRELRFLCWRS
ncbi:hypothetical protein LINPERHAP1_LOCUS9973, partial [Linum perenne]